jgi:hypothetical protein
MAEKIGKDQFFNRYVKEKKFNVSLDSETVGILSDLHLNLEETAIADEFARDIWSKGTYSGSSLQIGQFFKNSLYFETDFWEYATPKVIASPLSNLDGKQSGLPLTEEDITQAISAVRKQLIPEVAKNVNKDLKIRHYVIAEDKSSMHFAWAVDLAQDGKKVIIGCYICRFLFDELKLAVGSEHEFRRGAEYEILFALSGDGKVEKISLSDTSSNPSPSFSFINAIDLNGDGVKEIIIENSRSPQGEPYFCGLSIAIFSHTGSGWKRVYQSAKIARFISE